MGETIENMTAMTSEFGDERPDHVLGVSIRCESGEVEFLAATGLEEHPPMDWTPLAAHELIHQRGYTVVGKWSDVSEPGGEPLWQVAVARSGSAADGLGDEAAGRRRVRPGRRPVVHTTK